MLIAKRFRKLASKQRGGYIQYRELLKISWMIKNLPVEKKKKVLWTYNHSEPYVETILQLAQKLKQR